MRREAFCTVQYSTVASRHGGPPAVGAASPKPALTAPRSRQGEGKEAGGGARVSDPPRTPPVCRCTRADQFNWGRGPGGRDGGTAVAVASSPAPRSSGPRWTEQIHGHRCAFWGGGRGWGIGSALPVGGRPRAIRSQSSAGRPGVGPRPLRSAAPRNRNKDPKRTAARPRPPPPPLLSRPHRPHCFLPPPPPHRAPTVRGVHNVCPAACSRLAVHEARRVAATAGGVGLLVTSVGDVTLWQTYRRDRSTAARPLERGMGKQSGHHIGERWGAPRAHASRRHGPKGPPVRRPRSSPLQASPIPPRDSLHLGRRRTEPPPPVSPIGISGGRGHRSFGERANVARCTVTNRGDMCVSGGNERS